MDRFWIPVRQKKQDKFIQEELRIEMPPPYYEPKEEDKEDKEHEVVIIDLF